MKNQVKKIIAGTIISGAILVGGYNLLSNDLGADKKLKCDKSKILFNKDIDWIIQKEDGSIENKGKIKSYLYISNKKVLAIKDEDITKRTKNAQFIKKEKKDGEQEWEGRFYAGDPFYKDGDDWFQTETATTTIENFKKQTKISLFDRIFKNEVLADSSTIYSGAGDGRVENCLVDTWNNNHDATDGTSADYTGDDWMSVGSDRINNFPLKYRISRHFLPFDTSGLPDDASITAVLLKIYSDHKANGDNDGDDWINVIQTTQASNTTLSTADFNQCGSVNNPTEGATRIDMGDIVDGAYNTWTLNSTGRGWISKTGYSKLGLREGHDAIDDPPTVIYNYVTFRNSEYTGTTYDPYLEITYTTGTERQSTKIKTDMQIKAGNLIIK